MKYPMLCNWVTVHPGEESGYVFSDRAMGRDYAVSNLDVAHFAMRLDGHTNPYRIQTSLSRPDIDQVLSEMRDRELIRTSRVTEKGFGTFYYALLIPRRQPACNLFPQIINAAICLSFLPLYIVTALAIHEPIAYEYVSILQYVLGIILGYLSAITLHESGHAMASLAYNQPVFEAGVGINTFLPSAYVMLDEERTICLNRVQNVQVNLAGVEVNLLLSALFRIMMVVLSRFAFVFYVAAIINEAMAAANLCMFSGLDGLHAIERLLGVRDMERFSGTGLFKRWLWGVDYSQRVNVLVLCCGIIVTLVQICFACFLLCNLALPLILALGG